MKDNKQKNITVKLDDGRTIILTIKDFREWLFLDNDEDQLSDDLLEGFPPIIGPILYKKGLIEDIYMQPCTDEEWKMGDPVDWMATLGEMIPFMSDKHLTQWFNACKHIFKDNNYV